MSLKLGSSVPVSQEIWRQVASELLPDSVKRLSKGRTLHGRPLRWVSWQQPRCHRVWILQVKQGYGEGMPLMLVSVAMENALS